MQWEVYTCSYGVPQDYWNILDQDSVDIFTSTEGVYKENAILYDYICIV